MAGVFSIATTGKTQCVMLTCQHNHALRFKLLEVKAVKREGETLTCYDQRGK